MFIGFEIKANQNQAKPITLDTDIKLSQAVLDPASKGNKNKDPVCLVAEFNKKQFILAVLDPNQAWQTPLDLMFAAGTEVKFFVRGSGTVHLTGFESYDDLDDMSMSISSDEEVEEEDESEVEPARKKIKEKATAKKSPKVNGVAKTNGKKTGKVPNIAGDEGDQDDDDDDDSDDDDFDEEAFDDDDDDDDDVGDEDDDDDDDEEMLEDGDSDE